MFDVIYTRLLWGFIKRLFSSVVKQTPSFFNGTEAPTCPLELPWCGFAMVILPCLLNVLVSTQNQESITKIRPTTFTPLPIGIGTNIMYTWQVEFLFPIFYYFVLCQLEFSTSRGKPVTYRYLTKVNWNA